MSQNRSSAVMQQRVEAPDSLDHFPTPPWAARALVEHVLIGAEWARGQLSEMTCWEPACGTGEMVRGLRDYFAFVRPSDVHDYSNGQERVADYLVSWDRSPAQTANPPDWVITNPPFRLAAEFVRQGLQDAKVGVAMLVRTAFIEGVERYQTLYSVTPPMILAPFAERVPMVKGRCDPKASTATSYCWLVWAKQIDRGGQTVVRWIPPCRKALERPGDYEVAQ